MIQLFDPTSIDPHSSYRGGGRFIQLLKNYLSNKVELISNLSFVNPDSTLIIPFFDPFQPPLLTEKLAKKQIIVIYDVIPLKYKHNFPVGIKGTINAWKNKRSLKNYDLVVTISEVSKADIHHYLEIPEEKIKVIYPTLTQTFLNKQAPVSNIQHPASPYLIYVGDVNWNKNIVNIARAIKIANIPCVFVGKSSQTVHDSNASSELSHPWQQEFKQFVEETKGNPLFHFPGYVSDEELKTLYQNASCNLLVSRDEGFGFSYLEAAHLGTPSLLADTPISHEIANDTALFVNPENPKEIADQINLLATPSSTVGNALGAKAKERASFFSPEKFKEMWADLLTI